MWINMKAWCPIFLFRVLRRSYPFIRFLMTLYQTNVKTINCLENRSWYHIHDNIMLRTYHVSFAQVWQLPGKNQRSKTSKGVTFKKTPWLERCQWPSWRASWAQAKPPSWITSWPRRLMVYASRLLKMSLDRWASWKKGYPGCLGYGIILPSYMIYGDERKPI